MSKMKHLLRKLHIGGAGFHDHHHHHHRMDPSPPPPQTRTESLPPSSSVDSSSSSAAAGGHSMARTGAAESPEDSVDFNFFEEEFQMQLALAISVSDPDSREDPETAQINAAKQISLACSPPETLIDSLSLRYWSSNFVNYDEKVMDGFYDVYSIGSASGFQRKIPMLLDLQAISVTDNVDYEVTLVNGPVDPLLLQLQERAQVISMECQILGKAPVADGLIQKIADLVVDRMGGPVSDADEMLKRWTVRSYELRNSLNSIVLPLGCIDVGLSRHRALLFKVLADRINLPCMLVKGSYFTGTDEGAVNLIKFNDESEYIIDLMGAPGILIPAEVPSTHLQTSGSYIRNIPEYCCTVSELSSKGEKENGTVVVSHDTQRVVIGGSSNSLEKSILDSLPKGNGGNLDEENQKERFEHEFGKLIPLPCMSPEGGPSTGEKASDSDAQKMKVRDVSRYVISAAKNPEFAQKLHAVLLESGASPPPDLFSNMDPRAMGELEMLGKMHALNIKTVDDMARNYKETVTNEEQSHVCPNRVLSVYNDNYGGQQWHPAGDLAAKHPEFNYYTSRSGYSLHSDTNTEGLLLVDCGTGEPNKIDDRSACLMLIDPSLNSEQPRQSSKHTTMDMYKLQCEVDLTGNRGHYVEDRIGKILNNMGKDKESDLMLEAVGSGLLSACSAGSERMNPVLGEVGGREISWEDLQIGERVGIGSYGEVYRGEWNGTEVAVKKFMDQDISGDALAQFKCEVEIMLRVRHPNVVLFMGAVTHPPNLSILTEYLPRGSLYKLLHRPNNQLDEKRRLQMALDVVRGMNYLHTSNPVIVHRDLKTPNLLVDKNWVVKVCDFGLSRIKHHTFLSSKSTAGTPEWMAPEVLRNEPSNEKSDVYSFGVILWELATLRVPWTGMNSMQVVGAVGFQNRHLDITEEIDPTAAEIILDCWHRDPQLRPSFAQIISRLRQLQHLQRPTIEKALALSS